MRLDQQMRQNQQQKQSQKLVMTQQLQQSINILQYGTDELLSFLENKSLENPLMEVTVETSDYDEKYTSRHIKQQESEKTEWVNQVPDNGLSLFDYLIQQIHLNYRDTSLRTYSLFLVEYIDVNGYLTITLEEACEKTGASPINMLDALTLIQMLEPAGVGARNLQECLLLQIERDDRAPDMAYIIVEEFFEELANRKWLKIEKKFDISLSEIQQIFDYIQKLTPFPGALFDQSTENFVYPDLIIDINKEKRRIDIARTSFGSPKIKFQANYFKEMSQYKDEEVSRFLNERKQEFDWIKKGVDMRGDTILRVGEEIVRRQPEFFLDPAHPLSPMQLKDIAKAIDVHESTVSRAVNGKYLETGFGIFELRSFFTVGLSQKNNGEDVSTQVIKADIQKLIDNEDKKKPLSDQKIADLLTKKDLNISRRTIAKYRDELGISASSKRKRFD